MTRREMWVRVTGQTVFAFDPRLTGSQLTSVDHQIGTFRGQGFGVVTAAAVVEGGDQFVGQFDTRLEAIAAILRKHDIVPTPESVGIR